MKKEYNYLNELTEKSNKYKVKVKVVQKARPQQSPGKKKIQRLLLQDDKGHTIKGTIFENDIDSFEQAVVRNAEYESYTVEDHSLLYDVIDQVRSTEFLFQVGPTPALNASNLLSWLIREIKIA